MTNSELWRATFERATAQVRAVLREVEYFLPIKPGPLLELLQQYERAPSNRLAWSIQNMIRSVDVDIEQLKTELLRQLRKPTPAIETALEQLRATLRVISQAIPNPPPA